MGRFNCSKETRKTSRSPKKPAKNNEPRENPPGNGKAGNRAYVLHPFLKGNGHEFLRHAEARLEEAANLARAIGLDVVRAEPLTLTRPVPATLLGKGTVERLHEWMADEVIGLVVIDHPLSPVQQRNLERAWNCKVIDRTGLILEIFGERARSREGRLQVELAHLSYQRSRLVRSWTHLERQRGGFGFLGGPGEAQIETDRRILGERITRLKRELGQVTRTRALHRRARKRVPYPVIALVGYTNAGKSTLFNQLTGAHAFVEDMLFATLDPLMRGVKLPSGRRVILSDTVGFVSALPMDLVAAFRATLEEVREADLILHVRDISDPDNLAQREDVHQVLRDLDIGERIESDVLEVLNKADLLTPDQHQQIENRAGRDPNQMLVSAVNGEGVPDLLARLDERLNAGLAVLEISVPLAEGARIAWLYRHGEVMGRKDDEAFAHFRVRLAPKDAARFEDPGV
ncbi:MAG: GTPase HflX [Alphaproteobacteria bacterium]|nr:GTPase HflX [Alphaproteobacteria bacterium]